MNMNLSAVNRKHDQKANFSNTHTKILATIHIWYCLSLDILTFMVEY